jgi:hypothetical protein
MSTSAITPINSRDYDTYLEYMRDTTQVVTSTETCVFLDDGITNHPDFPLFDIGRKITSLTLMTIMLAGGMVIAAPSMMPVAHAANANLFVSAENSQFDNYMSGPQVIEVVVIDSDIDDTDEAKGEPDVTINGKILRMVQAVDGNWYGYFAD